MGFGRARNTVRSPLRFLVICWYESGLRPSSSQLCYLWHRFLVRSQHFCHGKHMALFLNPV